MARSYKRKSGARNYKSAYDQETLSRALEKIRSNQLSIRKASRQYQIPFGTLRHKFKGMHSKDAGGQKRLSHECESLLMKGIDTLAEWKVPLGELDLRVLVKSYLDVRGIADSVFRNNLPGQDWLKCFMKRHKLTQRLADNVRNNRAEISPQTVNKYFDELSISMEGVAPENVYNYDKTNITDNPNSKKVIVSRGHRRVERKMEHSKQSISVMFCGSAAGEYMPPMVVYGAENLYSGWTENGPRGAVYDSTLSGWFDSRTFEFWFKNLFLPNIEQSSDPKVIIGDNLPSHFSPNVIQAAVDNNVRFITMPPNATHLCQPLDVAVFQPAKRIWRAILEQWRKESRLKGSVPKEVFPALLKRLCDKLLPQNLVSGFRATGLCPLNREEVLKRLPGANRDPGGPETSEVFNDSVMELLQTHCGLNKFAQKRAPRKRGKKIAPGKAITLEDFHDDNETSTSIQGSSRSATSPNAQSSDPSSATISTFQLTDVDTDEWVCNECHVPWQEDGDDRWIVCDICDKQYHLQCSGIRYHRRNYYRMDIESMSFTCMSCEGEDTA